MAGSLEGKISILRQFTSSLLLLVLYPCPFAAIYRSVHNQLRHLELIDVRHRGLMPLARSSGLPNSAVMLSLAGILTNPPLSMARIIDMELSSLRTS